MVKKEPRSMLPGYLIIETTIKNHEFLRRVRKSIKESPYIIQVLAYRNSENICVKDEDRARIKQLLLADQCLETSQGFIEGGRIVVTEGPLKGRESMIKKINRCRREAVIGLEFIGKMKQVKIGLEIVESV